MMNDEKLPSNREAVILDILINADRPGREIRNEYSQRTGGAMPLGSLYTTLARMETAGFVTSEMGDSAPHRRGYPRKFFSITGSGTRALNNFQIYWATAFKGGLHHA